MQRAHDAIVVGGGVIGCAVAYELARRSVEVLLLDRSLPGRATSASAGGLWPVGEAVGLGCGVIYHGAREQGGTHLDGEADASGPQPLPAVFRDFLIQSNAMFPRVSEELRESSKLDIEYAPGNGLLFVTYHEKEQVFVRRVAASLPAGVRMELLSPGEVARLEPGLTRDLAGAALLHGEHQVNPMLLAEAYKRAAIRYGAAFEHDRRVTSLRRSGDRIVGVEAGDAFYPCRTVVNAAGAWAGALAATAGVALPVFPVRGQIVLTETLPHTLHGCLSTAACYMAQKAHGELLIGSTTERAGFDVSVTEDAIRSLCRGAVPAVPALGRVRVKRIWAGLRPGTPDELPVLGPVGGLEGYANATGGFRTGIVAAPLTARVVAGCIVRERPDVDLKPFTADRFEPTLATVEP